MGERRNFARQYTFEDGKINEELDRLFIEVKRLWLGKVKEYADFPIINFNDSQEFDGVDLSEQEDETADAISDFSNTILSWENDVLCYENEILYYN